MTLVNVQPDKEYVIEEKRLRFTLDYDVPATGVDTLKGLLREIAALQEARDWTFIPTIPRRTRFANGPCCAAILLGKAGDVLAVDYSKSPLQADSDDAHNFGEVANLEGKRLYVEGKIDWIARCHFWVPALFIRPEEVRESVASSLHANPHLSPSAKVRELAKQWQIPTTNW